MSSQEAVDLVAMNIERQPDKKLNAFLASQELLSESARRWKDEEGDYRDDITAIIMGLPSLAAHGGYGPRSPNGASRTTSPRARSPRRSPSSASKSPKTRTWSPRSRGKSPAKKGDAPVKKKERRGLTRMISVKETDLTAPKGLQM